MGKPDASDAELWRAVDAANARAFIERLDTPDTKLSAGAPNQLKGMRVGEPPAGATSTTPLDLAERRGPGLASTFSGVSFL